MEIIQRSLRTITVLEIMVCERGVRRFIYPGKGKLFHFTSQLNQSNHWYLSDALPRDQSSKLNHQETNSVIYLNTSPLCPLN